MRSLRRITLFSILFYFSWSGFAQRLISERASLYGFLGTSGAQIRQFNDLLEDRGLSPIRNRYRSYGLGYQTRVNDFVLGLEISQHQSKTSELDDFDLNYRTSRFLFNVGYAMTEEGKFQLIHYLSLGTGYLNFQMLPRDNVQNLETFLENPRQGLVLRENDIQKGSQYFGDFLTEIGFQLSYDFDLPGRSESLIVLAKLGYSFSPLEGRWNLNGLTFNNAQSGAFLRVGAGLTIPDRNFSYKDASIGISLLRGVHFSKPTEFNEILKNHGFDPFEGTPTNWGIRILSQNRGWMYGVDLFNVSQKSSASTFQSQSLNSLRVYANAGLKFFQYKNIAIGALGGLGYGNIRYSILERNKPDFPEVFEKRNYDGYLTTPGMMGKPELILEYGLPMTNRKFFDLVFSVSGGYELALSNYRLGELSMSEYVSGPFLMFGIGVRP